MALPIDLTRAVRSRQRVTELVEAVRDAPLAETETDALEWKGGFDLADNKGRAKIAKAILGFANREPRKAQRTFEGCAYLLVGVSPGHLSGVTPVDVAQLEAGVTVYTGGDPDWRADYAEVDGYTVLVVTVEAPRPGDGIHPAKKSYQPDFSESAVFVRHGASTDPATPEDYRMLSERAAASSGPPPLDVALAVSQGVKLHQIDLSPDALEALVERERARLEYPLTAPGQALLGVQVPALTINGEYRSKDNYRKEVEAYLEKLREDLDARLFARAVLHEVAPLQLEIQNETDATLARVRVRLKMPENIGVASSKEEYRGYAQLPKPPVLYGRAKRDFGYRGLTMPHFPSVSLAGMNVWEPDVDQDPATGRAIVNFKDEEIRPQDREELPVLYLAALAKPEKTETIEWEATSPSTSGRLKGTVNIQFEDREVQAEELMAEPDDDDE